MSTIALRCAFFALGLAAFAARLVVDGPVRLHTWDMDPSHATLVEVGSLAGAVAALFGGFYLVLWAFGGLRPPARFARRAGRLVVPPSPSFGGAQIIVWMIFSAIVIQPTVTFEEDAPRLAYAVTWQQVLVVLMFWAVGLAFLLVPRPKLVLDAHGVTFWRVVRAVRVSWDELCPGGPLPPKGRRPRELTLELTGEPVFGDYTPTESLPLYRLHIDPTYLADTIRYYVDHPEARAGIGTAELSPEQSWV